MCGLPCSKPIRLEGERMNRNASAWIVRSLLIFAAFAFVGLKPLQAQVDTGSITGTVTDLSGAVVSGAKVTLTNEGTGTVLSMSAGADGVYDFSPVRIGNYRLEVAAPGFKTVAKTHVVVDVSARVLVDSKLQPGAVSETVEVTSEVRCCRAKTLLSGRWSISGM